MKVCNNDSDLDEFLQTAFAAGDRISGAKENPILIDKFLVDAIALDVDPVADYGGEPSEQSRDRKGADSDAAEAPLCHAERSEASPTRRASAQPEILRSAQTCPELRRNDKSMCMVAGIMEHIEEAGIPTTLVSKHSDAGGAPFLKDLIDDGTLQLLINTPIHTGPASAEGRWRAAATARRVPLITTLAGARAAVSAIRALSKSEDGHEPTPLAVKPLQSHFASQET
jgi:carbamoyl-phosphate synthase large subunit